MVGDVVTPPGPWSNYGSLSCGCSQQDLPSNLSRGILDRWPANVAGVFGFVDVVRHPGLCECHSCALCSEVSHRERRRGGHDGGIALFPFKRGATGGRRCLFMTVSQVISRFMKIDLNNLLQLFARTENSEWFSKIFVVMFEVNITAERKQAYLVTIFL